MSKMFSIPELSEKFINHLATFDYKSEPKLLYEPIKYIMDLGGKRIRPALVLAAYNMFDESVEKAMNAALAVEMFHNFSLVHDDLMDDADIRRGKASVHIEYDENTAILSGDAMLIMSYQLFEAYAEDYARLTNLFSTTAMEVCEGQRMDMDFETESQPSIDAYIEMIALKTSVLIACGLKMGAIIAGASETDAFHLYEFGKNMGIAFQIQDDILDTFGNQEKVGKKIGGDILQRKKTYLYLKSMELLSRKEAEELLDLYSGRNNLKGDELIERVKHLFKTAHVEVHAQELKMVYQQLAMSHLDAIDVAEDKKQELKVFAENLLDRNH